MYLLFLDESGSPPSAEKAEGTYLVIGGVIIPEGAWHGVANDLATLKRKYGVVGEIKWKYFGTGNKENSISHLSQEDKDELRKSIFSIITSRKAIKVIVCVTCVEAAYKMRSINTKNDIYHLTYKGVTERFQYFLQDASRETGSIQFGMVISDHRMSSDDDSLRQRHHELVEKKGKNSSAYENIIETIQFAPSHYSAGLQLADMTAGAVHRSYQYGKPAYATMIKSAFRKSASGKISGYGLVKMPKDGFIEPPGGVG